MSSLIGHRKTPKDIIMGTNYRHPTDTEDNGYAGTKCHNSSVEWGRCHGRGRGCDDMSAVSVHPDVIYVVTCNVEIGCSTLSHVPPSFLAASSSPCAHPLPD